MIENQFTRSISNKFRVLHSLFITLSMFF